MGMSFCEKAGLSALQLFQGAGFSDRLADFSPKRQDGGGRDGQLVDTDGQEGLQQGQIRSQLAADADPNARFMGGVGGQLQRPEDGGVVGVKELAQIVSLTVAGQGVLGQIVGAH